MALFLLGILKELFVGNSIFTSISVHPVIQCLMRTETKFQTDQLVAAAATGLRISSLQSFVANPFLSTTITSA